VAHTMPRLHHEVLRTLFLHLEQAFLGLVNEFAERSVALSAAPMARSIMRSFLRRMVVVVKAGPFNLGI